MRKGSDRIGVDKELVLSFSSAPDLLFDAGVIQAAAMTLRLLEGDVQHHVHVIMESSGNKPWVRVYM